MCNTNEYANRTLIELIISIDYAGPARSDGSRKVAAREKLLEVGDGRSTNVEKGKKKRDEKAVSFEDRVSS